MRKLARKFGCPLTFAGMMLAKSAANPKVLIRQIFQPHDDEHPIGAQILGEDASVMAEAARALVNAGYDIIDLNFACPAPKVIRQNRGGALLAQPDKAIEMFKFVRDAINHPVTVKLRYGFDNSSLSKENFWQIVEYLCDNNVDALIIHPRSVSQRFRGEINKKILKEVKNKFPNTIIIGSGNIFTANDAITLLKETGTDGVAIARGAIGNPWIFNELRAHLENKTPPEPPTIQQQREVILEHLEMICQLYPLKKAIPYFRKFVPGYCKRHPERRKVRSALIAATNYQQFVAELDRWYR